MRLLALKSSAGAAVIQRLDRGLLMVLSMWASVSLHMGPSVGPLECSHPMQLVLFNAGGPRRQPQWFMPSSWLSHPVTSSTFYSLCVSKSSPHLGEGRARPHFYKGGILKNTEHILKPL